jgi:3'-5' exonuclease
MILDIETYSLDDAAQFIEEPTAPSNYKDPAKIAAYIEEKRVENLSRCALDPDLCRVVAVGTYTDAPRVLAARTVAEELDAIWSAWDAVRDETVIGFNLLSFDLPVLIRRSQYLGIEVPSIALNLDKYRTPHIDLMERLSFNGKIKAHSLDFYCRRFGIAVEDTTTGADVDAMVKAEDWDSVIAHCRADLHKTRLLAERLGYVAPITHTHAETATVF